MSDNFVNPTYYKLQKALIESEYSPGLALDITLLIPSLSIISSIESETMYGVAQVIDSVGLLENTPLRGEEKITFEIADSKMINENQGQTDNVDQPYKFVGYIYKISNVETSEINDTLMYDLHFISYQSFKAGTYEIIRSFNDVTVSSIVRELFEKYYKSFDSTNFIPNSEVKDLIIPEETVGTIRCWIPKMRPEEAMTFLSKRSYSSTSPSCLFRFFESSRGYHYITDEAIFKLAEDELERKFKFTYLDAIPNRPEFFEQQLNNIETIKNTHRVNSLDDIYSGTYRNRVIELDVLSRELNLLDKSINQYDYLQERNKYFVSRLRGEQLKKLAEDKHTETFINSVHRGEEDVKKTWLVIQNYTKQEAVGNNAMQAETYYANIISNRQAYSKHIESITVNAKGPGRFDISAGDVIELDVKKFQVAENNQPEKNKHLSGNYIVKSVVHKMDKEEMYNEYVMIKKDWSQIELDQEEIDRNDRSRPGPQ
jgi:hypothetical protein